MASNRVKLDVFGRLMLAELTASGWQLFDLGPDGKRRLAQDVAVPAFVSENELEQYLADLFHESATGRHCGVRRLPE